MVCLVKAGRKTKLFKSPTCRDDIEFRGGKCGGLPHINLLLLAICLSGGCTFILVPRQSVTVIPLDTLMYT